MALKGNGRMSVLSRWVAATACLLLVFDGALYLGAEPAVMSLAGSLAILGASFALYREHSRRARIQASLERRVAERTRELAESAVRLRSFLLVAQDAVVIIDNQGEIVEFNPAATVMFGYAPQDIVGRSINLLMPQAFARNHDSHLAHARPSSPHSVGKGREMVGLRRDGSEFPIELTVGTMQQDEQILHVGVIRDITERKDKERRLSWLASTDALTGTLNRRSFLEQGADLIKTRQDRPATILMLDADHFKRVNDHHGHAAGDAVLKALGGIMLASVRTGTDLVGRLGGEEFAILLPGLDARGASALAGRLLDAVRALRIPLDKGTNLSITISIGMASARDCDNLEQMLMRADRALYQAKDAGRDRMAAETA